MPQQATHDKQGEERVPKTVEQVAGAAWAYVVFMQRAARAVWRWPEAYGSRYHKVLGGEW